MTDNNAHGHNGADKSGTKGNTKDIAEMLRLLRETVGKPAPSTTSGSLDESIEERLREKIKSASTKAVPEPIYDVHNSEKAEDEPDLEDKVDAEYAEDENDDDPWYNDEGELSNADVDGDGVSDEDNAEIPESEDDDDPWYSEAGDEAEDEEREDGFFFFDDSEDIEPEIDEEPDAKDVAGCAYNDTDDGPLDVNAFPEEEIDDILDNDEAGREFEDYVEEPEEEPIEEPEEEPVEEPVEEPIEEPEEEPVEEPVEEPETESYFAESTDPGSVVSDACDDEACVTEDDASLAVEALSAIAEDVKNETVEPENEESNEDAHLDETDIILLETLGYSPSAVEDGDEFVAEQTETNVAEAAPKLEGDVAYDYEGGEYLDKKQSSDILAGYKRKKKSIRTRFVITSVAALMMLIYEVLVFRGVILPWMFNQYEFALCHIMFSVQILVIIFAVSARNLCFGIEDLFCGRSTPYSVSSMLLLANIIYSVIIAIVRPESYMLFNFVPSVAVLLAVGYEYLLICHEENTFRMISSGKSADGYAFESDDCSGEVIGERVDSLRAYKTKFNKNYFLRTRKRPSGYNYLKILVPVVAAASLLSFAVSMILNGNLGESLKLAILVMNFAAPIGVLGTYSLPIFMSSEKMLGNKGAMIGHSVADEYADVRFVTFDEEDLFPSMKASHVDFKPSGGLPVSEILRKTGLLFSVIGGPISRLVELPRERDVMAEVRINGVFDDGISATVDGDEMMAGSARFLSLHGISLPSDRDERDSDRSNEVLYISIGGAVAARYYIKYRPDRDFVKVLNRLGDGGVAVGIRTRNPGVNADIIARRCPDLKYRVYTIKSSSRGEDDLSSRRANTESGLFARGKAIYLAYPLLAAKKIRRIYRADRYVRIVSTVIGGATVVLLAMFGMLHEFNSLQAALYQLAWLIPTVAVSLISFKRIK